MNDTSTMRSAVRQVVLEVAGHSVSDTESIVSSGLIDSLSVVKLIAGLEKKLNVVIPAANIQPNDFDNVDLILETLERVAK
jgi:acyl carrier protein